MQEWRDPARTVHTLSAMLHFRMFPIAWPRASRETDRATLRDPELRPAAAAGGAARGPPRADVSRDTPQSSRHAAGGGASAEPVQQPAGGLCGALCGGDGAVRVPGRGSGEIASHAADGGNCRAPKQSRRWWCRSPATRP